MAPPRGSRAPEATHLVVLEARVPPGGQGALESFLAEAIPYYEEPGGIRVRLDWDRADPLRFRETIGYADEPTYAADQVRVEQDATMRSYLSRWRALLEGPPDVSVWRPSTPR